MPNITRKKQTNKTLFLYKKQRQMPVIGYNTVTGENNTQKHLLIYLYIQSLAVPLTHYLAAL